MGGYSAFTSIITTSYHRLLRLRIRHPVSLLVRQRGLSSGVSHGYVGRVVVLRAMGSTVPDHVAPTVRVLSRVYCGAWSVNGDR